MARRKCSDEYTREAVALTRLPGATLQQFGLAVTSIRPTLLYGKAVVERLARVDTAKNDTGHAIHFE